MDERSLEDSSSDNEETSSRIFTLISEEDAGASSSGIFEISNEEEVSTRNIFRDSTSRRILEESIS